MTPEFILQLITSLATLITLIFLIYQIVLQTRATRDQIEATKNQVYTSFVKDCLQLDQLMIQYPECRKYNLEEGEKELILEIKDPTLLGRVLSMEELIIDSLENVYAYIDQIPKNQRKTWMDYSETMKKTAAYKYYTENYKPGWYDNSDVTTKKLEQ